MEFFKGVLCVTGTELLALPMSINTYSSYVKRGKFKVLRRACNSNPSLIEYNSLPKAVKEQVDLKYGKPEEQAAIKPFKESIGIDPQALEFFTNYKKPSDGKGFGEDTIIKYCNNANVLNAVHKLHVGFHTSRRTRGESVSKFWPTMSEHVNAVKVEIGHTLPGTPRELQDKYEKYIIGSQKNGKMNYSVLISLKHGNTNTEKLCPEAKDWLIAQYSLPIKRTFTKLWLMYNDIAEDMGWKYVQSETTISNFLNQPENVKLWFASRHGEEEAYNALHVILKTKLPIVRDALWYSDGTKLNFYFRIPGSNKRKSITAKATAYVIIDVYSEAILGWNIAATEDHVSQILAMRMAMLTSGQKPEEWRYDNQGGHKKMESNNIHKQVAQLAFTTQPYNGKSKTIENMFGRFQQQVQRENWFYTGQNITSKKLDSKANIDFILANVEELPTFEEAVEFFRQDVEKWNTKLKHHKHGRPHMELYSSSVNPNSKPFEVWDAVNAFWVQHPDRIRYKPYGLHFELKTKKYHYEVYDGEFPDWDFVDSYLNSRFVVKYDPFDMSQVALYTQGANGLEFVALADTKREVSRATRDLNEGESRLMRHVIAKNKERDKENEVRLKEIWERTNISPQRLIETKPTAVEPVTSPSKGQFLKQVSTIDLLEDGGELVPIKSGVHKKW